MPVEVIRVTSVKNVDWYTLETNCGKFQLPKCAATGRMQLSGLHHITTLGKRVKEIDGNEI